MRSLRRRRQGQRGALTRQQSQEIIRDIAPTAQLLPSGMRSAGGTKEMATDMLDGDAPTRAIYNHHSCCYRMLNGRSRSHQGRIFKFMVMVLIAISCVNFLVSTVPGVADDPVGATAILWVEACCSMFFMFEYAARMVVVPSEKRQYRSLGCIGGRLRFALTFDMLVDLISFLPFVIERAAALYTDLGLGSSATQLLVDLPQFGWLRATRIFRLFKVEKYTSAFRSVVNVLNANRHMVGVLVLINAVLILVLSSILYFLAPPEHKTADFESLPATMYLAVLMLTGQGVPEGDLPWYTKIIVGVTALLSTALFVLPASILTWGFEAEAERSIRKRIVGRARQQMKRVHQRGRDAAERRRVNSINARASGTRGGINVRTAPDSDSSTPLIRVATSEEKRAARARTLTARVSKYLRLWWRGGHSRAAPDDVGGTSASDGAARGGFRPGDRVVVRHGAGSHWYVARVERATVCPRSGEVSYAVRVGHDGATVELLGARFVRPAEQSVPCGVLLTQRVCAACCSRMRDKERSQLRSWRHLQEVREVLAKQRGSEAAHDDAVRVRELFNGARADRDASGGGSETYGSVDSVTVARSAAANALVTLLRNEGQSRAALRRELTLHLSAAAHRAGCAEGAVDYDTFVAVAAGLADRAVVARVEREDVLGGEAYVDSEPDTSSTESMDGSEGNNDWERQYE